MNFLGFFCLSQILFATNKPFFFRHKSILQQLHIFSQLGLTQWQFFIEQPKAWSKFLSAQFKDLSFFTSITDYRVMPLWVAEYFIERNQSSAQ